MGDLYLCVRRNARRYGLLPAGETVVVGVSGGPDSLCLLHVLSRLAPEWRLALHVAHLNHGLRGAESEADARMVADLAAAWQLPFTLGTADVATLAARPGISLEEAARQARYGFLARVAVETGSQTIAVGHNADDQAETVLMHFLRGSGLAGLRGMLPRSSLEDYGPELAGVAARRALSLVRPLLEIPRHDIELYCSAHGLQPRFDRSNEDRTFFRNRLRHELLPTLEQYNPAIRRVLSHTAAVMAGDYEVLAAEVRQAWERILLPSRDEGTAEIRLDLVAWRSLPTGLQRETIRRAIRALRRSLRNVNWEHVERAVWLAREGETGQEATLVAGLALRIDYDTLRISGEDGAAPRDLIQIAEPITAPAPGTVDLGNGWQLTVRGLHAGQVPPDYNATAGPWTAYLDADVTGRTLRLRRRLPGERFQPQGMGGHSAKISEFMINAKIPQAARAGWPVLEGRQGVAWLCGLRLDERAAVGPHTREVWEVRFERLRAADGPAGEF